MDLTDAQLIEQLELQCAVAWNAVGRDPLSCGAQPYPQRPCALCQAAARLRALGERTWQPIETAPKMRKIIVCYKNALGKWRTVMACYYTEHALEMHDDYADVGEWSESHGMSFAPAGWYEEHDQENPLMPLSGEPLYWQHIPHAPRQAQETEA